MMMKKNKLIILKYSLDKNIYPMNSAIYYRTAIHMSDLTQKQQSILDSLSHDINAVYQKQKFHILI